MSASAVRKIVQAARLCDADPRLASLAGVLVDALGAEASEAAQRAKHAISLVLNNSNGTRFVPRAASQKPRRTLVKRTLRALRKGSGGETQLQAALAAATAIEQVASIAASSLRDERLRLPGLAGIDGELEPDPEIRPGTLLLSNSVDGFPGRAMYVVLGADDAELERRQRRKKGEDEEEGDVFTVKALCVNRPVPFTVADVLPSTDLGPLNSNFVFQGGLDEEGTFVLHRHAALPGASQLTQDGSIAAGASIMDVAALVQEGEAIPTEFKVVHGCTRLLYNAESDDFENLPGAIAVRGAAVGGLVLAPALFEGSRQHRGDVHSWYDHDRFFHQDTMWHEAMARLGGQCAAVAELHPSVVELVRAALFNKGEGAPEQQGDASTEDAERA